MYNQLIQVHIADIHFGCMDPAVEYDILLKQFLEPISKIHFDILSIDGDLFDKRLYANSDALAYAIRFVNYCDNLCESRNAALIIIGGTESHDAGQIGIFKDITFTHETYIVEHTQFIYTHGAKILCIPEEYGKGKEYYDQFLQHVYDFCFFHGALVGGYPGVNEENLDSPRAPVFSIDSFSGCRGPIIGGHVHTGMCLCSHMYYVSSPMRWRFGEEQPKGYAIVVTDMHTMRYSYQFLEIHSFEYKTIDINQLSATNPDDMIKELNQLRENGIHFIRLNCQSLELWQQKMMMKYVHEMQGGYLKLTGLNKDNTEIGETNVDGSSEKTQSVLNGMDFLLDDRISDLMKFVMYVNFNEGKDFISIEQLKDILSKP